MTDTDKLTAGSAPSANAGEQSAAVASGAPKPSEYNPSGSSSSSSTSSVTTKATTTSPISTTIPVEFKGSSNQDVIEWLERKIAENKPLSDEDLAKIRRRQKIEGIISGVSDAAQSIANLIATHHYAPNMYNPKEGMSAKAKERFEKEKADREAKDAEYFNYAMQLGKLKTADQDRALQAWQTEQTLARQDRAFDAGRKDKEDEVAFRDRSFERQGEWHEEEGKRWESQFKESVRQFNVSSANERARIGLESQRLANAMKEGQMTFNLGSGNGNVTLTLDKLNAQTVSRIYNTLPEDVRSHVQGDPIVKNGFVVGYKPPTTEAMLIAIGANVETSPATQKAIKQVAGLEKGKKPKGYDY